MAYEEQQAEHRRIVVETPNARREEIHSEATRYPDRSGGVSGAALAAIVVGVIALAAIIILFVMNHLWRSPQRGRRGRSFAFSVSSSSLW